MAEPVQNPLTVALAAGREQAFADAYDRFGPDMLRAAATILGCRAEAEDAVQDVFVALARARRDLVAVANLRAYLFAALRNAAARRATQRHRRRAEPLDPARHESVARTADAGDDRGARLERAVRSLPPEQREVIALKIDGGLTFADVAAALGISPNTAASRYRYALEALRAALGEE